MFLCVCEMVVCMSGAYVFVRARARVCVCVWVFGLCNLLTQDMLHMSCLPNPLRRYEWQQGQHELQ